MGGASSRGAIALLVMLLLVAVVMTPVQIRPAAYNMRDPPLLPAHLHAKGANQHDIDHHMSNILGDDDANDNADAAGATDPPTSNGQTDYILNIYVVFHKTLDPALFEGLRLPNALPDAGKSAAGGARSGSMLDVVLGGNGDVTFFATNKAEPKEFNATHPLFLHRTVNEWDTDGYALMTESQYGAAFNEFGAMASIYYSDYTYRKWEHQTEFRTLDFLDGARHHRRITLKNGLHDAFVGILQFDMRLNDRVLRMIRRRIARTRKPAEDVPDIGQQRWARNALFSGHSGIRVQEQSRAVRLSRMHQVNAKREREELDRETKRRSSKCCVFYSVTYPMRYLIKPDDDFTAKLLKLYNMHFFTTFTYADLKPFAILDAFVIPFAAYNRMLPFLENVMRNGVRAGALTSKEARATVLKQLEQALALFLGLMGADGGYDYVMMPLRHEVSH